MKTSTTPSGFAKPEIYEVPSGSAEPQACGLVQGLLYQAASWKTARWVVAKVEHHAGELFPRGVFIVTNLTLPSRAVVRFHNKRGTAEQWIKQGKHAVTGSVAIGSGRTRCGSG